MNHDQENYPFAYLLRIFTALFALISIWVIFSVTKEKGQARTGLGTPEIPLIKDLIEFRRKHESDFATDASLRAELQQRLDEIDQLRETTGVEGWSFNRFIYQAARRYFNEPATCWGLCSFRR